MKSLFNQVIITMEGNMVTTIFPSIFISELRTFYFDFDWCKYVDENLNHELNYRTTVELLLELQTPGTMKLYGSTKYYRQNKNCRKYTKSRSSWSSFSPMSLVDNQNQQTSEVLYTLVLNKFYANLLNFE